MRFRTAAFSPLTARRTRATPSLSPADINQTPSQRNRDPGEDLRFWRGLRSQRRRLFEQAAQHVAGQVVWFEVR